MPSRNENLARSLEALHSVERDGVVRSSDLTRTHRERLVSAGFLNEVVKGWLVVSTPGAQDGDSTAWYANFWRFVSRYLSDRFGDDYCLSPEASIKQHVRSDTIPRQVIVITAEGSNQVLNLPFDTSLMIYRDTSNFPEDRTRQNSLWLMSLPYAICKVPPAFFRSNPDDVEIALRMVRDPSAILRVLLESGSPVVAARIVGAYEFLKEPEIAAHIRDTMEAAGHRVRSADAFEGDAPLLAGRVTSPYAARVLGMWASMRQSVVDIFPEPPGLPGDMGAYMTDIDERYASDAYNSLSIEGYRVSPQLIDQVRRGDWRPDGSPTDSRQADALAARGYYLAFQSVEQGIRDILGGANAAAVVERQHQSWYREMFSPAALAGILKPSELAGYRNNRVYLRGSRHVPPAPEAVLDCMEALFLLLREEHHPAVRAVLGHFVFVYIHPYPDGNGRIGRFLMNAMLASGGYPWTVIRQARRSEYLGALESASTEGDIAPFAKFVAEEMERK